MTRFDASHNGYTNPWEATFEFSGIPTKFRLVMTHFDASHNGYTNPWEATLGYLRNNGDGQLDYVHAM